MPFYENIICSWASIHRCELNLDNVLHQNLYFNRNITKSDGSSIFYPDLANNGIIKVSDLIKDGHIMSFEEACAEKNLKHLHFIQYSSVLTSLGNDIKQLLHSRPPDILTKHQLIIK